MATACYGLGKRMSWWRRNAVALCAVAILAPATAVTVGWHEWIDYFSGRPVFAERVEQGGRFDYGGSEFGPVSGKLLDAETFGAPHGTSVIEVTVPVDPSRDAVACLPPTLQELDGAERTWNEGSHLLEGVGMTITSCQGDWHEGPYEMRLHYLVPSDARGPFTVQVSVVETLPRFASFEVDPKR